MKLIENMLILRLRESITSKIGIGGCADLVTLAIATCRYDIIVVISTMTALLKHYYFQQYLVMISLRNRVFVF